MPKKALETVATKSKVLVKSMFSGYDACINTYVGCEFGCSYCYVRWFVKDKKLDWGEFVRVRTHIEDKLPNEIRKGYVQIQEGRDDYIDGDGVEKSRPHHKHLPINEARLVLATMTDNYQPSEVKHRITRKTLQILTRTDLPQFKKVGIFTRSPLVLQDIELIKKLPRPRVHFTVTPFAPKILRAIEPYTPRTERRWDTIKKLKEAGIRTHVNIAPVMPLMSEHYIEETIAKLVELKVDEYFVDPFMAYKESYESFRAACQGVDGVDWDKTEAIIRNKDAYQDWKNEYYQRWLTAWNKIKEQSPNTLPIWSDHQHHVWVDMNTGQTMSKRLYGDDLVS